MNIMRKAAAAVVACALVLALVYGTLSRSDSVFTSMASFFNAKEGTAAGEERDPLMENTENRNAGAADDKIEEKADAGLGENHDSEGGPQAGAEKGDKQDPGPVPDPAPDPAEPGESPASEPSGDQSRKPEPLPADTPPGGTSQPPADAPPAIEAPPPSLDNLKLSLIREAEKSGLNVSLCLYDFATGQWLEKDARKIIYPASMIKTLYLLTALYQIERGALSLDDTYILTEQDKYAGSTRVTGTGILQFAEPGNMYTIEELLRLMVALSDNVAANIILDIVGPQEVTAMAARLGLVNTRGTRKMYELESALPSNSSTALELTEMLLALEDKWLCGEELKDLAVSMMLNTEDKSRIGRYIKSGGILVANKVGTVNRMVGDMALIYFPDRPPVALTVMIEDPPTREEAAKTIGRLASIVVTELQ